MRDLLRMEYSKGRYDITDAVYKELLTVLRQKIDAILEGGQHD